MKHLLGLEGLSAAEVTRLLDTAGRFLGVGVGDVPKRDDLKGKVVVNLFYEPSTRTRVSFGLAARRMWAYADRFWDTAEGRVIPAPVAPRPHRHDSLLAQYLVADPMFDDHAHLMERRHRHVTDETAG